MSDLLGNPEDWFSHEAHKLNKTKQKCSICRCLVENNWEYEKAGQCFLDLNVSTSTIVFLKSSFNLSCLNKVVFP